MEREGLGHLRTVPASEDEVADWVVDGVRDWYAVHSLVPAGFQSYARLLHPAHLGDGRNPAEVRWATVAAANGRRAHAGMQRVAVTGSWAFADDGRPAGHLGPTA